MFQGIKDRMEENAKEELVQHLGKDGVASVPHIGTFRYDRESHLVTFTAAHELMNELAYRAFPTHKEAS